MIKRMLLMLLAVGIIFGGIFGYKAFMGQMMMAYMSGMKEPPVAVSVIKAAVSSWQPQASSVGTLRAVRGIDAASEVSGIVQEVFFKSGDEVKEGQILVQLNADTDIAQLHALEAEAELAGIVYDRDRKQLEVQAVSQAVVDADNADMKSRQAQVAQQKAYIAKKSIIAPFDARIGISTVTRGQYLGPGEKIVTLQALERLYVDFYLPQQELSTIAIGQKVSVTADAYLDKVFIGEITGINPRVDDHSRNVHVEAAIPNTAKTLLPGMFVSVRVQVGQAREYLTLPQTALIFNPYGETVYVVQEKEVDGKPVLTVKQVFITVGETRGDQVAVLKGIKSGDTVVTSGQLKLKNGAVIVINNDIQPANEASPLTNDQ